MTPRFFASRDKLRAWFSRHRSSEAELWVGFYRKASGRGGITYDDALEEALCFGWIDGVRKRLDDKAYVQRFTPRRANSYWSAVNVKRAKELIAQKRMTAAGLRAFQRRDATATAKYSFERAAASFTAAQLKVFRSNRTAWEFFQSQPAGYRRVATFWVVGAKKEETQSRRLATLMNDSAAGRRIGLLGPGKQS
jgi:uncharacterized protein YdeI (YjbR/CyaY-like superfamily)